MNKANIYLEVTHCQSDRSNGAVKQILLIFHRLQIPFVASDFIFAACSTLNPDLK